MKKNVFALSVAAALVGFAGTASAGVVNVPAANAATKATVLEVNPGGIGHILAVPYFTTQGTNASLLNIVNTDTTNGKAVKVRYRSAVNSDDIFDFTLFLSPGDVWTAHVSANGEVSSLRTSDTSCTLPRNVNRDFITARVPGAAHTREGYIEILNTADIPRTTASNDVTPANDLYQSIKHVNGVAPCGAALNRENVDITDATTMGDRGYSYPTGGLFANWTIVNVQNAATNTGEAVAVEARVAAGGEAGQGNFVVFPQTSAVVANPASWTADPLLAQGLLRAASYDFPDLSTPYVTDAAVGNTTAPTAQANALSQSLAVTQLINEYLTGDTAGFSTDWVFSQPTRRYGVAVNYSETGASRFVQNTDNLYFNEGNSSLAEGGNSIDVQGFSLNSYDREEREQEGDDFVISPGNPTVLTFPGEVTILSFNADGADSVFGAALARKNVDAGFSNGWLRINVANLANGAGVGLPVIGYAAVRTTASNLGGTWQHRYR